MAVYNVLMAVVELIEANSEAEAIERADELLRLNGFDTYEGQPTTAFLSDDQDPDYPVVGPPPSDWVRIANEQMRLAGY